MIAAEVAECLRVYGGTDGTMQVFGRGKQVLCLEHAIAVADPPPVRAAGQAQATADGQVLSVLKGVPDACDGRRLAWVAIRQRQACSQTAEPLERSGRLDQATRTMVELAAQWDRRLGALKRLAGAAHAENQKRRGHDR